MLREYQEGDYENIRRWVNDPETTKYLSDIFLYPQSAKQTRSFLDAAMGGGWNGFVIAYKDTEEYIGQIDFVRVDQQNGWGEMGMVIGEKSSRGRGFGREAIEVFLRFAFEELRLNRVELSCYEGNTAAQKSYEAVGFTKEGVRRSKWYRGGTYQDQFLYGLLFDDWKQHRQDGDQSKGS